MGHGLFAPDLSISSLTAGQRTCDLLLEVWVFRAAAVHNGRLQHCDASVTLMILRLRGVAYIQGIP